MATFGPEGIQDTKGHTSLSPPEGGTEQVGLQGRDARKTGSEGPIVENSPVSAYFLHRPLGHLRSAPALRLYERYIPSGALHPVERGFGSWTHGDLENKTRGADKTPEAQRTPRSGEIQRPKDSSPEGRRERSAPQRHHLNGEFFGLTGGAESLRPVNTLRLSGLLSMYLFGHLVKGSEGPQGSSGQSPKSTGRSDSEQGNLIPSREAGTVVGFAIH